MIPEVVIPQREYDDERKTCRLRSSEPRGGSAHRSRQGDAGAPLSARPAIEPPSTPLGTKVVSSTSWAHRANGLTGSLADSETVEVLTHTSMPVLVDRKRLNKGGDVGSAAEVQIHPPIAGPRLT